MRIKGDKDDMKEIESGNSGLSDGDREG